MREKNGKGFGPATRYFLEVVIKKRPYVRPEWIDRARRGDVEALEIQSDGRIRVWVYVEEFNKFLRVVFLEDGITVHNAFFDRGFRGGGFYEG